jgi:hypothetical protein
MGAKADTRPLSITFTDCDEALSADALRISHIELAHDSEANATLTELSIEVQCEDDTAMVRGTRRDNTATKRMAFDPLDTATRGRIVALGVAELVRELSRMPTAAAAPYQAPKPLPRLNKGPSMPPAWAVSLGPTLRAAPSARMIALGGRMTGERRATSWLVVTLTGEGTTAERSIPGGALRWSRAAVELGARASVARGLLRFYAEGAIGGAFEHLSGRANEIAVRGARFSATNAVARAGLGGELPFLRRGLVSLTLDAHRMLRSLKARNMGEQTIQIGPLLLGGSLTVGARW